MKKDQITELLANITSGLRTTSDKEIKAIEDLQKTLAEVLLSQDLDLDQLRPSILGRPLKHTAKVDKAKIEAIISKAKPLDTKEDLHVEARSSGFQGNLLTQAKQKGLLKSTGLAGVLKVKTEGPFTFAGGGDFSLDFYRRTKLNTLYIIGQSLPALLFKTTVIKRRPPIRRPIPAAKSPSRPSDILKREVSIQSARSVLSRAKVEPSEERVVAAKFEPVKGFSIKDLLTDGIQIPSRDEIIDRLPKDSTLYEITCNTIWIRANLLNSSAPADHYCPLRIKSGTVLIDAIPVINGDKITVEKTTSVYVNLKLDQKPAESGSGKPPFFGADARAMNHQLPTTFNFSIKDKTAKLGTISDIKCKIYGQSYTLKYNNSQKTDYKGSMVTISMNCDTTLFSVKKCDSQLIDLEGKALIKHSHWVLYAMEIDIDKPLEADGSGAIAFECEKGLSSKLKNTDEIISLLEPFILIEPGNFGIKDQKSSAIGQYREVNLWKDESNPHGTTALIRFLKESIFIFQNASLGEETLTLLADISFKIDRPVKVNGDAIELNTKKSVVRFWGKDKIRKIGVFDLDLFEDNNQTLNNIKPLAFALQNALFKVTPPIAVSLGGEYDEHFKGIVNSELITYYGVFNYFPTLPDPYVANLGRLTQGRQSDLRPSTHGETNNWRDLQIVLSNTTRWKEGKEMTTSFDFILPETSTESANIKSVNTEAFALKSTEAGSAKEKSIRNFMSTINLATDDVKNIQANKVSAKTEINPLDPSELASYVKTFTTLYETLNQEPFQPGFSLLDVSSNANQMGISFTGIVDQGRYTMAGQSGDWTFPLEIDGLNVTSKGLSSQAFALPQIAWEPLFNLAEPAPDLTDPNKPNDPPIGFNYYPNDGIPTLVGNFSSSRVALSPIPMVQYLEKVYKDKSDRLTYALFNLPFGMVALSMLNNKLNKPEKSSIQNISPTFVDNLEGGIQLELRAGTSFRGDEDNLFQGYTVQWFNVQDLFGLSNRYSTLGSSVTQIFNEEFAHSSSNLKDTTQGVPLKNIGISGYGASIFSDWHNKNAAFAATSQATFNVATGRTMHEVVQVKSVIYPWGIFVVRTITIVRLKNGYVIRMDSGWQAESDGKFYYGRKKDDKYQDNPYEIYPGLVKGLFNIRNIRENELIHEDETMINKEDVIFNPEKNEEEVVTSSSHPSPPYTVPATFRGLTFDADIEIEGVVEGAFDDPISGKKCVPTKGALGFVQLRPQGTPVTPTVFSELLKSQNDSIGAPVNCTIKIAGTEQRMKINRVDVNNSVNSSAQPIFVAATRGSVILPKDGSWTMVSHQVNDGTVTPLPTDLSVPLIKQGLLKTKDNKVAIVEPDNNLWRIAHPKELLKLPDGDTVNFGFLQNLNTQKVLFLTPSFKPGIDSMLSKTPPLLADAYRLMNTKGIFPNVGDGNGNLGTAIQLLKGTVGNDTEDIFSKKTGVTDAGEEVYELLKITKELGSGKLLDQGYKLAKKEVLKLVEFDLPNLAYDLIDTENLKIRIAYEATKKAGEQKSGKLDYNINSFADKLTDQWKGRMNNIAMVVSLGPFNDLMTITGNFNSEKGKETSFGGSEDNNAFMDVPSIKFSDAVEPVIKILQILSELSSGDYGEALKKGLQVAMSNTANIWEYKFEATKDIPLVRFPPGKLYDAPQTPLKLEASMSIGVYFNAALKVTTDPKQLLPTVGAFFNFHGGLQVMCMSVGAGSIYAVGNVDLRLASDTSLPLALTMKFGFGVQLGVGLPVIGNVSVLFMVGIEIYVDSSKKVAVTAIILFRGHAEIAGGLVGVTITIEARGTIEKSGDKKDPTTCKASVSFGLDISVFLIINISFHESWEETRQIA